MCFVCWPPWCRTLDQRDHDYWDKPHVRSYQWERPPNQYSLVSWDIWIHWVTLVGRVSLPDFIHRWSWWFLSLNFCIQTTFSVEFGSPSFLLCYSWLRCCRSDSWVISRKHRSCRFSQKLTEGSLKASQMTGNWISTHFQGNDIPHLSETFPSFGQDAPSKKIK